MSIKLSRLFSFFFTVLFPLIILSCENHGKIGVSKEFQSLIDTSGIMEIDDSIKVQFSYIKYDSSLSSNVITNYYFDDEKNIKLLIEYFYFDKKDSHLLSDSSLVRLNNFLLFDEKGDTIFHSSNYIDVILTDSLLTTNFSWGYDFNYSIFLFEGRDIDETPLRIDFKSSNDTVLVSDFLKENNKLNNFKYGIVLYLGNSPKIYNALNNKNKVTYWTYYFIIPH